MFRDRISKLISDLWCGISPRATFSEAAANVGISAVCTEVITIFAENLLTYNSFPVMFTAKKGGAIKNP